MFASAQEPYAVLIDNGTALEFRYDNNKDAYSNAMSVGPFVSMDQVPWHEYRETIVSAVFDSSFANCTTITSTALWFAFLSNLQHIVGIEYLNTSNVTDMYGMFWECWALTSLDLSNFSTSNVTDMATMFNGCTALTTINVGSDWSTESVTNGQGMFEGCTSLVGGAGTTYDADHTDYTYAHIDGGSSNPGYLTGSGSGEEATYWQELVSALDYADSLYGKARDNSNVDSWMLEELSMFINRGSDLYDEHTADEEEVRHLIEEINWICYEIEEAMNSPASDDPEPYAVLSDNNTVLTFYYDNDKEGRGGMDVGPFTGNESRAWHESRESITKVVFDNSFAQCNTLTSTRYWFYDFTHLTEIVGIENLKTDNVVSMQQMFPNCSALRTLDVSHFNTANVTEMHNMFYGCSSLETLDLSSFSTSNVTKMGWMFENCSSLRTIYVGNGWDTSNLDTRSTAASENMFAGCTRLVGGRGTTYDANHVDAEYAHIDGGTANPGYLTDINGSGTSDLDQRRTELLDMIEQLMQQAEVCAYELNRKDPQRASNLWDNLADIEASIMDVKDRTERAESDAELDECEDRIRQIREGIEWLYVQIAEYAIGDASFDGLTARVSGSATLDDAFESVGGRAEAAKTIAAIIWNGDEALTADMLDGISNPNLLVYVTEASKAPAGVQNLIINGTAEEIILTDDSGNNNFYCPQSFTAQSISYTRSFSQTTEIEVCRGWETIALPFTVQSIRHQSHGALTPFGGGNNGYPFWLRQLSANGLTRATQIEANRPYLICMPNNRVYPSAYNQNGSVTFSSSNVTVPVTTAQTATGAGVTLRAAFQQVAQGSSVYTLNVGEARGEHPEGSVFEQDYREVRPFQAYTTHNAGTRYITLTSLGVGGDETTGVSELRNEELGDEPGEWYSLDGRRLEGKPTKKGVYVKDGHKYIIR